ncbi:MAG: hydrolase [Acidobacteria bacterium]|nr:MAG: hydrolase [Acidobacteriota bacterium]
MLTRRDVFKAGLAAGVSGLMGGGRPVFAAAPQPKTKVSFDVPPGGCDCHVHVFGDPKQYPFFSGRTYTPETATVGELKQLLSALRLERVVIVQPSVYGTDNACTLDGIRALGDRARGVAVIDDKTTDAQLDAMGKAGIRGIRLNLATAGITDPAAARQRFQNAVARAKGRGWHIQFNTQPSIIEALSDMFLASPVPIVIDHFGGAAAARGLQQPGFGALVNLVKSGKAYVKISGAADSVSTQSDLADVAPLARALVGANPQRILWGTNWPHPGSAPVAGRKPTDLAPPMQTDDGKVLNLLPVWVPDAATRRLILVENPARLYGF